MTLFLLLKILLRGEEQWIRGLNSPLFYVPLTLFWIGIIGFISRSVLQPRKQLRALARTLAERNDVRATGPLIDTFKMGDRNMQEIATDALIELLPRLRTTDANLLNAEQRAILCHKLTRIPQRAAEDPRPAIKVAYTRAISFRVAIFQAFAQVGDSAALPIVERLAQGEAKTVEQKRIQAEAQACLPPLKLRIVQMRNPQTLLRAASASDTGAETLLRAAKGGQETNPVQLLRPSQPNP